MHHKVSWNNDSINDDFEPPGLPQADRAVFVGAGRDQPQQLFFFDI